MGRAILRKLRYCRFRRWLAPRLAILTDFAVAAVLVDPAILIDQLTLGGNPIL